jgi:hypothetical protein
MASNNDSPKTIGQIIDHIEQIREEPPRPSTTHGENGIGQP